MAKKSPKSSQQVQSLPVKKDNKALTGKVIKELKELKYHKNDLADDDAPEIVNWEKAVVGKFYRP